jgi:hypothetical protein
MTKQAGHKEAIRLAIQKLKIADLNYRCQLLGLNSLENAILKIRMFGGDYYLSIDDFRLINVETNNSAKQNDHILLLHYLLCDVPIKVTNELITFRDLAGGQFYWEPFVSRTTQPLCQVMGNDLERLKTNLNVFDWKQADGGDFTAHIHTIGNIYLTLKYQLGDAEFPPGALLLFDSSIKRVFTAEDVAVLSSRVCLELVK